MKAARKVSRRQVIANVKQVRARNSEDKRCCFFCSEGHIMPNGTKWKTTQAKNQPGVAFGQSTRMNEVKCPRNKSFKNACFG